MESNFCGRANALRLEAASILGSLDHCLPVQVAVRHVADVLQHEHPGLDREVAIVAVERALWAPW